MWSPVLSRCSQILRTLLPFLFKKCFQKENFSCNNFRTMGQKKTKELTTHTSRKKDVHGTILCSTVTKALKRIQQKFWIWKKHFPRLHIFFPCDSSFGETTSAIYHVCIHVIYKVSLPPPCLQLVCVPTGKQKQGGNRRHSIHFLASLIATHILSRLSVSFTNWFFFRLSVFFHRGSVLSTLIMENSKISFEVLNDEKSVFLRNLQ